jgi:hypothetical protein
MARRKTEPNGQKRWFRIHIAPCLAHTSGEPVYVAAENTSIIYRMLEREGVPRANILSTTAYADVRPGCTPRVVREGITW